MFNISGLIQVVNECTIVTKTSSTIIEKILMSQSAIVERVYLTEIFHWENK